MADAVNQLLATEVALDKLGVRGISAAEAEQTTRVVDATDDAVRLTARGVATLELEAQG